MNTIKFKNEKEFSQYVEQQARKIINENKTRNLGDAMELNMNSMDVEKSSEGAQVTAQGKNKKEAPTNIPKEFKTTNDAVDVKMNSMSNKGVNNTVEASVKIEGSNSEKRESETNPFIKGQPKAKIENKKTQPKVTVENDPTKEGGVTGGKNNDLKLNSEDKEDKQEVPMTQVVGSGKIDKEGYSNGQTNKQVNTSAKNETDDYENKLRDSIKTIQLPESFKNKKDLLAFIQKEAIKLSNI